MLTPTKKHLTAYKKAKLEIDMKILSWIDQQEGMKSAIVDAASEKFNISTAVIYKILRNRKAGKI